MIFELWDTDSRNIIDAWESEAEAFALVRSSVDEYGLDYVASWALLRDDDPESDLTLIAEGAALAELARTAAPTTAG
jgi:hypothetical protein